MPRRIAPLVALVLGAGRRAGRRGVVHRESSPAGRVRTYYVAAEEVAWDYAPSGANVITGAAVRGPSTRS